MARFAAVLSPDGAFASPSSKRNVPVALARCKSLLGAVQRHCFLDRRWSFSFWRRSLLAISSAILLLAAVPVPTSAQQLYDGNQNLPPFGSFTGSDFDIISLQNGNLHFKIPILSVPQRGKTLSWAYLYDTRSWTKAWVAQPTPTNPKAGAYYVNTAGFDWFLSTPFSWRAGSPGQTYQCPTEKDTVYENYAVTDPEGAKHPVPLVTGNTGVTVCIQNNTAPTWDGSGIWASYNVSTGAITLTLKDGTQVGATREDSNGNLATATADTLNRNLFTETDAANVTYTTPLGKTRLGPQYTLFNTTDTNGNSAVYRVDYEAIDLQTSFCSGGLTCHEGSGSEIVPSQLTLPNSKTYQFTWFNNSGGEIQQIALPTGGSIAYTYSNLCMAAPFQSGNPTFDCRRAVQTQTVTQNGQSAQWSYSACVGCLGGIATDPYGNDEVHTWSYVNIGGVSSPGTVETKVQTYLGCSPARSTCSTPGTVLRTVATDYTGETGGLAHPQIVNVRPIRTTVTLDNGLVRKDETDYETFNSNLYVATRLNPTEKREYDYGTSAPGALLRRTDYAYLHTGNQNYISRNIVDRATTITTYDGSGNQAAQTVNEFDNYSHANQPMQASGAIHHDSSHSTSFTYRGNLTAVSHWLNTTSSFLTTTNQYDDAGNVISAIDPLQHKTSFDFTDSWTNTSCAPSGQGKAYLTKVTDALNHVKTSQFYSCTGLPASTTDENTNQTTFAYDAMSRLSQVTYPVQVVNGTSLNGSTTYTYTDTPGALNVEKTKTIDGTRSTDEFFYFDGLGRSISHSSANDQSTPWDKQDTCYDALNRKSFVSYPYQSSSASSSQVCSGAGDGYSYDPLNRVTQLSHSDGTMVSTSYTGRAKDVLDEGNGTQRVERVFQTDALKRMISVCEVTSTTLIGAGGTPVSCGQDIAKTGFLTSYSYDTLNNLKGVSQSGLNPRSFVYDSLSRLVTDTNPETGTVSYVYDNDSNVYQRTRPAPNQTNQSATVTATYSYDALHRLTQRLYSDTVPTYSNGTPTATYGYDLASITMGTSSFPITNSIGRLSWSKTLDQNNNPITMSASSYDSMGRTNQLWQCTTINCPSGRETQYGYDLVGDVLSATNGVGVTLSYSYNRAERLSGASSSLSDATHPGTMLSALQYNAFGSPVQATLGNGVAESYGYTARGWFQSLNASNGSTSVYSVSLTNPNNGLTGYSGNGNVLYANDSANGNWAYAYDAMNRLISSSKTGQSFTYVYDRFGNRLQQNAPQGGPAPQYSFDANNRIIGSSMVYDAAGNVTSDGTHTYRYDAENRIIQIDGGSTGVYTYAADGQRVHKVTGTTAVDDVFDLGNHLVAEVSSGGSWTRSEVYAAGRHVGTYTPATTYFSHTDWLGTERARSTVAGAGCENIVSLPYGDAQTTSGSCGDPSPVHFTGKLRDSESGLDDFPARYYSSVQGRWYSPDWSPVPVAIPYADLTDPRTLNLYDYVGDDPTNHPDADGHAAAEVRVKAQNCVYAAGYFGACDVPVAQNTVPVSSQTYKTADKAAKAALDAINKESNREGVEYGGRVVKMGDGKYKYTLAVTQGHADSVDVDNGGKEGSRIPAGSTNAGIYHTHPEVPGHDAYRLSYADVYHAKQEGVPNYVERPDGSIMKFDYSRTPSPSLYDPNKQVIIRGPED